MRSKISWPLLTWLTMFAINLFGQTTNQPPALPVAPPRYFKTSLIETNYLGEKGSAGSYDSRPCPTYPHTNVYVRTFEVVSNTIIWQVVDNETNEFQKRWKVVRRFKLVTQEILTVVTNKTPAVEIEEIWSITINGK